MKDWVRIYLKGDGANYFEVEGTEWPKIRKAWEYAILGGNPTLLSVRGRGGSIAEFEPSSIASIHYVTEESFKSMVHEVTRTNLIRLDAAREIDPEGRTEE
jgi:hypothetical protein